MLIQLIYTMEAQKLLVRKFPLPEYVQEFINNLLTWNLTFSPNPLYIRSLFHIYFILSVT